MQKNSVRVQRGFSALWTFVGILVTISIISISLGWLSQEFGPKAALDKYSWFIDQANRIEKMDKDIMIFKSRMTVVDEQYDSYGKDRSKWPPHIQAQYNQTAQQVHDDLIAISSQRNNLVREYNASSEKFNWSPFQTRPNKPKERFHTYATQY